jgi:hypothetical protein
MTKKLTIAASRDLLFAACTKLIEELKQFRREIDKAEHRLFARARFIETKKKDIWCQFYTSFDSLLVENNICDSHRYRNYFAAQTVVPPEVAEKIGAPSTIQAAKIEDPARRRKFIEAASRRFEDEGVPWSEQQAKVQRKQIAGQPPTDSRLNKRISREDDLYAENVALKKQIRALERELKEKTEQITKLEARLAK